jgi:hypothetical protein
MNNNSNFNSSPIWDTAGIAVSWICVIHCLLLPLAFSFLPVFGSLFPEQLETGLMALSVLIALISLLPAYFRHRSLKAMLLFIGGITLLLSADPLFEEQLMDKTVTMILGACLISGGHFLNRSLCRNCENCSAADECEIQIAPGSRHSLD